MPLVQALGLWGQRWTRRELAANEADLGLLLLWSLERSVDASAFGEGRTVVRLQLVDQPTGKQLWWYVNEHGQCEFCVHDPGFDVDLYLSCTLADIIFIVRGDRSLSACIGSGALRVNGSQQARRALRRWLNLGPLSKVRSPRG